MADVTTTSTTGLTASNLYVDYLLPRVVEGLKKNVVMANYAEEAILPSGAGSKTARWLIPVFEDGATTTLSETDATDGATSPSAINQVEADIKDMGEWYKISDLHRDTVRSGMLDVYRDQMIHKGEGAIEISIRTELETSTTFLHSGDTATGGALLAAGDTETVRNFARGASHLRNNNCLGFPELGGNYVYVMHPLAEGDLVTEAEASGSVTWAKVFQHTPEGLRRLLDNNQLVGDYNNVTAVRSTRLQTVTEDVSAYLNLMFGRHSVGWLGLGAKGPKAPMIKFKSPGPQDTSQPLDTYHTLGWKVRAVAKALDVNNRCIKVYSATA